MYNVGTQRRKDTEDYSFPYVYVPEILRFALDDNRNENQK